ncbi:DUF1499 domain-containing protein [Yoonia vestfoldensis]|jgi:hypothetical protein|uniref:DUF1499 domain-containing protein n=1 Tax=Yoonia vestfoldensis TaxID=245188 RepID=A0A1Y0EBF2_9RHOB|nr:DUF1499 domain-containing protein [Yoonia vestfoldensis]ARU00944.1 hypothetical protein LOKVESSMR4R_01629 [Yoonia vestfoldensis]
MIEIMIRVIVLVLALVIGAMTYVRLAPTDVARWHQLDPVTTAGDVQEPGGFKAVRQITAAQEEVLTRLDAIARATPRTRPIAGSIAERMVTYQTRSLIWGFPDHTTIAVQGDLLVIHARLRFGQSDMGVNRARVLDWLDQLGPLTAPP